MVDCYEFDFQDLDLNFGNFDLDLHSGNLVDCYTFDFQDLDLADSDDFQDVDFDEGLVDYKDFQLDFQQLWELDLLQ